MTLQDAPTGDPNQEVERCYFCRFGLIVTGKGERNHLPKLFRSLLPTGICNFEVIGFTGQRSPIMSNRVKLKMVGSGQTIPDKDATEIGFPARKYLQSGNCSFVILLDDLEYDRQALVQEVFNRYRLAFDTILVDESQRTRASVHFLVNMLEAYYFADASALNVTFGLTPPIEDFDGDVETIRHPKARLKGLCPSYKEVDDTGRLLDSTRVEYVLSKGDSCAYLRTLFAWCVKSLQRCEFFEPDPLVDSYRLQEGVLSDVTGAQL